DPTLSPCSNQSHKIQQTLHCPHIPTRVTRSSRPYIVPIFLPESQDPADPTLSPCSYQSHKIQQTLHCPHVPTRVTRSSRPDIVPICRTNLINSHTTFRIILICNASLTEEYSNIVNILWDSVYAESYNLMPEIPFELLYIA